MVTATGHTLGLFTCYLLYSGEFFWSAVTFNIVVILGSVDGELARATNRTSALGAWFDDMGDTLLGFTHSLWGLCLVWGLWNTERNEYAFFAWGVCVVLYVWHRKLDELYKENQKSFIVSSKKVRSIPFVVLWWYEHFIVLILFFYEDFIVWRLPLGDAGCYLNPIFLMLCGLACMKFIQCVNKIHKTWRILR